ncbi:hypothetical protein Tco_0510815 [Tanacetum coccineum]
MTLELADRSITRPKGVAKDVFIKVGSFHFPTDFVVVDFETDPRVPLILGRSFLRTGSALIDHANESINMINFIDVTCKDSFGEVLRLKKLNHPSSGSTTPLSNSHPSLISFETSNSLLKEFADELVLLDPFPPGNEDVDFEADLREIELLLNRDPSTDFSPKITFDPNPERFTDEPALVCLPPPGDDDDDKENNTPLNEQIPLSFVITSVLPTIKPGDSLITGDEHLSTFPEKEMDEFIKSSVEEIVPIPSKSEVSYNSDKGCDLPFCDNKMIFSNPLFGFNDDFTSSNDKSFLEKDILEDVESKDTNVSNSDELVLLNTPLFDEDECFDPGSDIDEIDAFLDDYKDSEGDVLKIFNNTTHNLSLEVFFDHEPQCFKDELKFDKLKRMVKVFDLETWEKTLSPSYVKLSSKDHHYLLFTIVIQILLTHLVNFLFSFGSEDTIFDPGIFAYIFYKPVLSHRSGTFICFDVYLKILNESPMEICSSTCSIPMDN